MDWLDYLNVFCMHAIHGGDFELTSENLSDFKKHLEIPEEGLRKFGRHGVAITDIPQFIDRVKARARSQGYQAFNKLRRLLPEKHPRVEQVEGCDLEVYPRPKRQERLHLSRLKGQ